MSLSQEIIKANADAAAAAARVGVSVGRSATDTAEFQKCSQDCGHFISEYVIIDQPQGSDFAAIPFKLWPAQAKVLAKLLVLRLIVVLKARQLGITWLCCAYALWLCLFRPGRLVLLFSKGEIEAYELARRIKVMYERLPEWMRESIPLTKDNTSELAWANGSRVQSLAATRSAGRSFTASLVLMDEAAFMQWAAEVYTALKPTIDGGGQLFVISTANGEQGLFHKLWKDALHALNNFATIFLSWRERPDRDDQWRASVAQDALSSATDLQEYPNTPEDAFQNTGNERFLYSIHLWDACVETLPPLTRREPLVLAIDGAVSGDTFGLVGISRHPSRTDAVAVRIVRAWNPLTASDEYIDLDATGRRQLDFDAIEKEIEQICIDFNVLLIAYDPMQIHHMMNRLKKKLKVEIVEVKQLSERPIADKNLQDLIKQKRIVWDDQMNEALVLREHLDNADQKVEGDRKIRLVKRFEKGKIDTGVCASMACYKESVLPVVGEVEYLDGDLARELESYTGR